MPVQFGLSGCTVRTDGHGVVYVFAEMFENPTLVGLPTHGFHVMFTSTDGGKSFTRAQVIRQITDPCFFVDPVYGRCVKDGFAGAAPISRPLRVSTSRTVRQRVQVRRMTDQTELLSRWVSWAEEEVASWPDDLSPPAGRDLASLFH